MWNKIEAEKVGVPTIAPKMHTTTPTPWKNILKGEVLERCIEFYKEDFELLNYQV